MKEAEKILTEFIDSINVVALSKQGKTLDDVSIKVEDAIYLDIKSKLNDKGEYKGIKIYC